jgi:hypothetical protein
MINLFTGAIFFSHQQKCQIPYSEILTFLGFHRKTTIETFFFAVCQLTRSAFPSKGYIEGTRNPNVPYGGEEERSHDRNEVLIIVISMGCDYALFLVHRIGR